MTDGRHAIEPVAAPIAAGLVVLVTLLGLIGTAIRDPRPHDIPVGVAGPAPAAAQITGAFNSKAAGTFKFTTYDSEEQARSGLDARDVDAVLVLGAQPKLIVATAMAGLVALTALATGTVTAGLSRLVGPPGLGLAGLIVVLLNLISSGGPAGQQFLPDAYRALSPWMPAGQLFSAFRGALYFDGLGVAAPVLVLTGWLVVGVVLMLLAEGVRNRARTPAAMPAVAR